MTSVTDNKNQKNSDTSNKNKKSSDACSSSSISNFFDLTDLKRNEDFKKKLRGLGRIYPLFLIIMLVIYILLALLTGFLTLIFVLPNPKNMIYSKTIFILIALVVGIIGIIYALWGIIAYSNGSVKHFKVFNIALAALIVADCIGITFCLTVKRKMIKEMFGVLIFLVLKLFLYVKSTQVKKIILEFKILESLKTKAKV